MTDAAETPDENTDTTGMSEITEAGPELVVLLDDRGAAIGSALKSEVHHASTPLHLAFSCYLFDAQGRLVVTRRASDKLTFPGVLTNSFCGHPLPGESLIDAVRRRAQGELGIAAADVYGVRLVLADFAYRAEMNDVVENERCPVLVARLREGASVSPEPSEVEAVDRLEWGPFAADVRGGRLSVSPWCREQVAALDALGPDPREWAEAGVDRLPEAARLGA